MRDPGRITRIMELLSEVWTKHPDLRLGQIVEDAKMLGLPASVGGHEPAIFYVEDDIIEAGLQELLKR